MTDIRVLLSEENDRLIEENAKLRAALRFAAGYISTYERHANQHPEDVLQWIEDTAQPAAPGGDA